jgi:HEPN domain-containing protein
MSTDKKYDEWFFQSDYNLDTAEAMFNTERYVYCVFMCHLSLEKALKGLLIKQTSEFPPKNHSLVFFVEKLNLKISEEYYSFLFTLNKISVPTRYPDDLRKLIIDLDKEKTISILENTKEVQKWIKMQ